MIRRAGPGLPPVPASVHPTFHPCGTRRVPVLSCVRMDHAIFHPWVREQALAAANEIRDSAATAVVGLMIYVWASRTLQSNALAKAVIGTDRVAACEAG